MKKNKWDEIFEETKGIKTWTTCVFVSFGIIALIIISKIYNWFGSNSVADVIVDTILSIITGVLGAAILNITYRVYENYKLSMIKSISFHGMLPEFFQSLEKLDRRERTDEIISMKFHKYKNNNGQIVPTLFDVCLSYSFKTRLRQNFFECSFLRICEPEIISDEIPAYTGGISDTLCSYEFYWANDETGFSPANIVSNESYKIYDALIDDEPLIVTSEAYDDEHGKIFIIYKLSLPRNSIIDLSSEHTIKFTVKLPMEYESILFLTHQYPTKNTEVNIDYSIVQDQISVYTMAITGAIPVKQQRRTESGLECYTHKGWILPKSGYVVSWWKK